MDILKDIRDILIRNKDTEHMLKIVVDWSGVIVYLDYDPEKDFEEKCIIPIQYIIKRLVDIPRNFCYRSILIQAEFGWVFVNLLDILNPTICTKDTVT